MRFLGRPLSLGALFLPIFIGVVNSIVLDHLVGRHGAQVGSPPYWLTFLAIILQFVAFFWVARAVPLPRSDKIAMFVLNILACFLCLVASGATLAGNDL
jgi:hypothetical protein